MKVKPVRGKQVMPTVSELRDYIDHLKEKASTGDVQAIHALLDLNRHKITLHDPEVILSREEKLAQAVGHKRG
ncbi:TPA: hypothetical protein NJ686_004581 [Vibrio parahaemolyticus]|nr:hypothetical protein [Vibrio parahaemolyticus]